MRNALRGLALVGSLTLLSGRSLQAQSASHSGDGINYRVSAVVHSFVRVVTTPSDPSSGLPPKTQFITNDPALRATLASAVQSEVIAPEAIATLGGGRQSGGAESRGDVELAGPVTIRYTVVTP